MAYFASGTREENFTPYPVGIEPCRIFDGPYILPTRLHARRVGQNEGAIYPAALFGAPVRLHKQARRADIFRGADEWLAQKMPLKANTEEHLAVALERMSRSSCILSSRREALNGSVMMAFALQRSLSAMSYSSSEEQMIIETLRRLRMVLI